jgi:hypothetical protein
MVVENSSDLTTVALGIRNNNPLNIRYSVYNNWKGQTGSNKGFCVFSEMVYGVRASILLLKNYISQGYNTIEKIVSKWAPAIENNTENYISYVSKSVGIEPSFVIEYDSGDFYKILYYMGIMESGYKISKSMYNQAKQIL